MVRMWGRIFKDHKCLAEYVLENPAKMQWHDFPEYLAEICYNLDLSNPVIMKLHILNYAKYNYVKFDKSDFVEKVDFDYLLVENIAK